ncbi:AcrR family transcriptional regulator [Leucobacter exalbidus]|uniref:AcrR family transcriptional regulator n=1 Tax=Leucobacter exalbidus TaxID=662960 RepID=A0A940PNP5_9MICO|nr:TetR/AcrR family transcriptional regulator [Leucobacter exalbidus]MBP1326395.1 AcrR family transcriptional regulator [Leucobacter exalbidus]
MPKISAATVVEHRAQQERLILDAAHAILEETGDVTSMREVAERAGLARSSVYHYFDSREALLNALVQDVFPKWTERVTNAMAAEPELSERIIAYAVTNVQLVQEGAHAVGAALAALSPGEALNEQATQMHRAIQEPLIETLAELGVRDPEGLGELINSVVHASTRLLESGRQPEQVYAGLTAVIRPMAREMQAQMDQEIKDYETGPRSLQGDRS